MTKRVIFLSLPLMALTALMLVGRVVARGQQPQVIEIPQPPGWVPFSADVRITNSDSSVTVGHFFRGEDGSTRLETGPTTEAVNVVSIHNIGERRYYIYSRAFGWRTGPMHLPNKSWLPGHVATDMQGLTRYPYKLALEPTQAAGPRRLMATAGFEAYIYIAEGGNVLLEVPALNFFPVVRQSILGRREEYSNVRVAPQPAGTFVPDPGMPITDTGRVGGITVSPSGNMGIP